MSHTTWTQILLDYDLQNYEKKVIFRRTNRRISHSTSLNFSLFLIASRVLAGHLKLTLQFPIQILLDFYIAFQTKCYAKE